MKIILSPAKKMRVDRDTMPVRELPELLNKTEQVLDWLRSQTGGELQKLWGCSDRIAAENIRRLADMDLRRGLTPAILSYEGIAYQYMAPGVFEDGQFAYVQEHLRILSAFYGVVRPLDGVTPYRLEMQAKASVDGSRDLYAFWGRTLYDTVRDGSGVYINLASQEYSRCIEAYLTEKDRFITCVFGEMSGGKLVQKGTYAKMARGEMVRYMAENRVVEPEELKGFDRLGYVYREALSDAATYVFERVK
ncbi:MAG: peroxide stress protein YaaA [Oscillospiraceae bacterium]|nr:peroxide stress protein YaaA [Oscillospiraceae bacterium]